MRRFVRKGLSEMMAIVIGIVLTIAIGAALWPMISHMIGSQLKSSKMIVNANAITVAVKGGLANVSIIVNVRNVGQTTLNNVSIVKVLINGKDYTSHISTKLLAGYLAAGDTVSKDILVTNVPASDAAEGSSVVVVVEAEASGHTIYAQTETSIQ